MISTIVLSSMNKSSRPYKTYGMNHRDFIKHLVYIIWGHLLSLYFQCWITSISILATNNFAWSQWDSKSMWFWKNNILFCDVFDILNLISTLLNCIFCLPFLLLIQFFKVQWFFFYSILQVEFYIQTKFNSWAECKLKHFSELLFFN